MPVVLFKFINYRGMSPIWGPLTIGMVQNLLEHIISIKESILIFSEILLPLEEFLGNPDRGM